MRRLAFAIPILALCACSPTTTTPTAPTETSASSAASAGDVVTPEGYAGVHVGMTLAQASAALGHAIAPGEDSACQTFQSGAGDPATEASFMAQEGKVTCVSFFNALPHARTAEGVGVGSTDAQVRAAYPTAISQPAKYDDPPAHDLLVWTTPDTAGYRFEIGDDGQVKTFHAGDASILLVEGCS